MEILKPRHLARTTGLFVQLQTVPIRSVEAISLTFFFKVRAEVSSSFAKSSNLVVGGFKPCEKYYANWKSSPNSVENRKYLKPPPSNCFRTKEFGAKLPGGNLYEHTGSQIGKTKPYEGRCHSLFYALFFRFPAILAPSFRGHHHLSWAFGGI